MNPSVADTNVYEHTGTVSRISGNTVFVSLQANIHCESCGARSACGVADSKAREIEVRDPDTNFALHEPVRVVIRKAMGLKAVFWAYVFPFVLMITVLFAVAQLLPEWQAGLLALAVLAPYYLLLRVARSFFESSFRVSVLKMS